jgi:hypothetical protein
MSAKLVIHSAGNGLMAAKRKSTRGNGLGVGLKKSGSFTRVIRGVLSKTRAIDAVYLFTDDTNVVHVFSVVRDFHSSLYNELLKKERAIERDFPEIHFEFHVRAHQGRPPAEAVRFDAELVFARR